MPKSKAEESYYPECVLQEILRKILQLTDRSVKDYRILYTWELQSTHSFHIYIVYLQFRPYADESRVRVLNAVFQHESHRSKENYYNR